MIEEMVKDREHVTERVEKACAKAEALQESLNAVITFVDPKEQLENLPEEGFDEIEEELEREELEREKLRQEAYRKEKEKNGGKSLNKSGADASCAEPADEQIPTVEELEQEFDAMETSDYEYGGIED